MISIDFSTQIWINSLVSGGSAPKRPTNAEYHISLNYWHNFREIPIKFFKNYEKMAKFPLEQSKIVGFH